MRVCVCGFFFFSFTLGRERVVCEEKERARAKKKTRGADFSRLFCVDLFFGFHVLCEGAGPRHHCGFFVCAEAKRKGKKHSLTLTRARGFLLSSLAHKIATPHPLDHPSRARQRNAPEGKDREKNGGWCPCFFENVPDERAHGKKGGFSAQKWREKHAWD